MPTFCLVSFAIGALLAAIVSARQFVVGASLLMTAAIAQATYVGLPLGQALFDVIGLFVCSQLGYVAGIGLRALALAKLGRSEEPAAPKSRATQSTITSAINRAPPP